MVEQCNEDSVRLVPVEPIQSSGSFELTIEDVFSITGRGTVVTGRVTNGTI